MGHPSNTKWHWPRQINTPNCNSIRPVVFAEGSGDLVSRHVCELSSNHEHSPWLWQANRHDDEKHFAQLKMRSAKMNSGKRVDGIHRFSAESSRSTESTKVELIDRFSVESSRFVRLDWFQGLVKTLITWGLTSPVTVTTVAFTAIIMVKVVYASSHRVEEWKSEGGIANISSSQAFAASITHQTRHCLLSADWLSDC